MCDIISIVKVKTLVTTLFCGVIASGALLAGAQVSRAQNADAAAAKTYYPEVFTGNISQEMSSITDFATDGETYVFADRSCITKISGSERTRYDVRSVSALDCDNGRFYYRVGTQAFDLSDGEPVEYTFRTDFPPPSDGVYKIMQSDGAVYFCATSSLAFEKIEGTDGTAKLKTYVGTVYALGENGVYSLDGLNAPRQVNPSYTDFSGTKKVAVGTTPDDLRTYSLTSPHMAMVERDAYFTEVMLNNLLGSEYFTVGETYNEQSGIFPFDDPVLVLCETGNAAIFTYGGKNYVTLAKNCVQIDSPLSDPEFGRAIVGAPDYAYSAPSADDALKAFDLKAGETVGVLGKFAKTHAVDEEFYLVEYAAANGEKAVGYVLGGMLIGYYGDDNPTSPDDKNYSTVTDDGYSDKDLIKVVILIVVIILLLLVALGYIVYVVTGKKKKNKE